VNRVTQRNEAKHSPRSSADSKSVGAIKGTLVTPAPYGVDFVDRSSGESHSSLQSARGRPRALPGGLTAGIQAMSGVDLSDVRVRTNSPKPARINAFAYARGNEIHLAPGQQRHLPHEAWHIVQQRQGRVRPTIQAKGALINDSRSLEGEADKMGALAQQLGGQSSNPNASREFAVNPANADASSVRPIPSAAGRQSNTIQRAIGIEIEVPVPVDDLTHTEVEDIKDEVENANKATVPQTIYNHKVAAFQKTRQVPYGTVKGSHNGFHVDVDHEARVKSVDPLNAGWPLREGGQDSIMEIVTEKADTLSEFNTTMDHVDQFVKDVDTNTDGLKLHWENAFGNGVNLGPLDYFDRGIANDKRPNHNWQGSVQVNIGIDVREYASLAKWYAKSTYADPKRASSAEQAIYRKSQENILEAVNVARDQVKSIMKDLSGDKKKDMGNLRGIRGWLTHLALYLIGGRSGVPGTTVKNLTPILLKSPQDIAIWYGMTADEMDYFLDNRKAMMGQLIVRTGRTDLDKDDPLNADVVKGKATNVAYQSALAKGGVGLTKSEENAWVAYSTSLGDLSAYASSVAYAGKPIPGPQEVGPVRSGSTEVGNIPAVNTTGVNRRGGVVLEFRNLPGFYEGPAKWRALGQEFFKEADKRNQRGGVKP